MHATPPPPLSLLNPLEHTDCTGQRRPQGGRAPPRRFSQAPRPVDAGQAEREALARPPRQGHASRLRRITLR